MQNTKEDKLYKSEIINLVEVESNYKGFEESAKKTIFT